MVLQLVLPSYLQCAPLHQGLSIRTLKQVPTLLPLPWLMKWATTLVCLTTQQVVAARAPLQVLREDV